MMAPGRRSKCLSISAMMAVSGILLLPNVSTEMDMGLAMPIAYEI